MSPAFKVRESEVLILGWTDTVLQWLDVRAIPQPKCATLILGRLDYGGANAECLPAVVARLIEWTGNSVP